MRELGRRSANSEIHVQKVTEIHDKILTVPVKPRSCPVSQKNAISGSWFQLVLGLARFDDTWGTLPVHDGRTGLIFDSASERPQIDLEVFAETKEIRGWSAVTLWKDVAGEREVRERIRAESDRQSCLVHSRSNTLRQSVVQVLDYCVRLQEKYGCRSRCG